MSPHLDIVNIFLVAILIAMTGYFVAAEFALVKVRSSRIEQLIDEGNKKALAAKKVISNLDEYLSACQLGITITALGLGWLGEPTIERLLHPIFESLHIPDSVATVLSFAIAFALITFLHVVVGELAPKTLAIQKAEEVSLRTAKSLMIFYKIMYPFIWVLNGSARGLTRLVGLKPASEHEVVHSEEELRYILSESYESGEINQSEYQYVQNIFDFDNRIAKEIMIPRTEMVVIEKSQTMQELIELIREEQFTRYPVMDGDKDNIIGIIHMKEIFKDFVGGTVNLDDTVEHYIRPLIKVIESLPIHDLLLKMQKERIHMAILVDEYGGTSGLVTVENIIEEIVGDIHDEFDIDEKPPIQKLDDDEFVVDGKVLVDDINELLGIQINHEDVDTIGGWILTENLDIEQGDYIEKLDYQFKVVEMEEHHIISVKITRTTPSLAIVSE